MKELIKVTKDNQGNQVVSARELYEFLEVKTQFNIWIKRMLEYGFEEDKDYTLFFFEHPQNKQQATDYALTLDASKEIAMIQRSEKGKEARQYFIQCEKALRESMLEPISIEDTLIQQLQLTKAIRIEQEKMNRRIELIEAKSMTRPDLFTIVGYGSLINVSVNLKLAGMLGRMASQMCKEKGLLTDSIPDPRFGRVKMYPREVLEIVFAQTLVSIT